MKKNNATKMVTMAMLAAVSIVLVMAVRFSPFPIAGFLEYDPADIPIFIGTFLLGPISGLILTLIVSVIQALTVSAASGWIGLVMHVLATGSFVVVAGLIYRKKKTILRSVTGVVAGTLAMTAVMVFWNLIFTPIFMRLPQSAITEILFPAIIPFNLLKGALNSTIALLAFKALSPLFRKLNIG